MKLAFQLSEIQTKDSAGNIQDMAVLQEVGTDNIFTILSSYIEQDAGAIFSPYSKDLVILIDPENDHGVVTIENAHLDGDNIPFDLKGCFVDVVMCETDCRYYENATKEFTGTLDSITWEGNKIQIGVLDADDDSWDLEFKSIARIYYPYGDKYPQLFEKHIQ